MIRVRFLIVCNLFLFMIWSSLSRDFAPLCTRERRYGPICRKSFFLRNCKLIKAPSISVFYHWLIEICDFQNFDFYRKSEISWSYCHPEFHKHSIYLFDASSKYQDNNYLVKLKTWTDEGKLLYSFRWILYLCCEGVTPVRNYIITTGFYHHDFTTGLSIRKLDL